MKNIFTLLFSTLIGLSVFASGNTGRVTVSFYGNNDYRVYIDGRSIASNNNRVYLNDLRPGRHTIDVYELKKNNKINKKPVYTSNFMVKPQYDLNIIVNRDGYVKFDEDRNYDNRRKNGDWNDRNQNNRNRDDEYNRNRSEGRDWDNDHERTYDRNRDYDRDRKYDRDENYDRNRNWNDNNRAMSDADFNQFTQKIRNQWLSKKNIAKEGLNSNYFTTYQVREVLQIFSSENDKLELAKLAYSRTVDQRNFSQLYDLFSSQGKDELDRYVRGRY
ncbi:DUF4476 domain-containing protein [Chitinophagaceae bacterium LB-8]|uniref:DUF4476 domain-containing protein n=1 Tax=Paraflavisolibacter caeni TaxID=2982496 RepID=A0A9X2XNM6_9BACT|nr:DUF4476 domain-containing protein [Paraflavisolibacter caeni]MCU7548624.1 DUF4476 domain-containing protein [Paraflavisolibacter caeni]